MKDTYQHLNAQKLNNRNRSFKERKRSLKLLRSNILKYEKEIADALYQDLGKAPSEAQLTEILPVLSAINLYLDKGSDWLAAKQIRNSMLFLGSKSSIEYEAKGLCLIISPWNYPFQLAMYPLLTAFYSGNTIILKPSEYTPAINKVIAKILDKTFSEDIFAIVEGDAQVSQKLLAFKFDHIFFTGSTPVGRVVMQEASKFLTPVTLELGGKSPVVIDNDYPLKKACEKLAWGKLVNAGQTCVAPDYIFVPKGKGADFAKQYLKYAKKFYFNSKKQDDYCSIISDKHFSRLEELVNDATQKGALVEELEIKKETKFSPKVLLQVTKDMNVMQEEIFGPILPIVEYENLDEVISYINDDSYPLSLYCFSKNKKFINKLSRNTTSGSFSLNEVLIHVGNKELAFGGVGESGMGRYHGKEGLIEFSNQRAFYQRKNERGLRFFFPPYKGMNKKILNLMFKYFWKKI